MEQKTHIAKPMAYPVFSSAVDIIIPFHGQYDRVARLIESIFRLTHSNRYNVCLVDDASPNDEFINSLTKVPGLQCVRSDKQRGFGGALEVGWSKTKNPWCVFMQSDCLVEDINWLKSLGLAALSLKDQNVRMVAPRTNNPGGGDPRQKGEKGVNVEDVILENTHLSMYCFMCHRDLFAHVGGFIKAYPYGWYEDQEFAHRLRKYGYKQAVVGNSWIRHVGEGTFRPLWRKDPRILDEMRANREKCIQDINALNVSQGSEK